MPINKNANIRYKVLDTCFSNWAKMYFIEDLVDACNRELYGEDNYAGHEQVHERQIRKDITDMETFYHIPLERLRDGHRVYYRYSDRHFSIFKQDISDNELQQLQTTISLLKRFKGLPNFQWIDELLAQLSLRFNTPAGDYSECVAFEHNPYLNGTEYITPIAEAVFHKQVLNICYTSFRGNRHVWDIHPYYLKQYNCRWFLFGLNDERKEITNIALDGIEEIKQSGKMYIETDIDFGEYFADIVGVTFEKGEVEQVLLRFTPERFPYVVSKPLHESQRVVRDMQYVIRLDVIPNRELMQLILSFGDDAEVLAPESLRTQMKETTEKMYRKYKHCT